MTKAKRQTDGNDLKLHRTRTTYTKESRRLAVRLRDAGGWIGMVTLNLGGGVIRTG